jgi:NNP family nitrate/nitrite transporter-like MFS transporter
MPLDKDNKACEIRTTSIKRPHMRGFWFATLGFFLAFLGWFHLAPLMKTVKATTGITKSEASTSGILAVSATIVARVVIGPLCDRFGARRPFALLLAFCAIPLGCAALVQNAGGLYAVRTLIGLAGASFVPCQFWTTQMFTGKIVGQANAMAGGWGNLGGGVTQATAPGLYEMFRAFGLSDDAAWRASLQIPAALWVLTAIGMWFLSDDCPEGHWRNRKMNPDISGATLKEGLIQVCSNYVTWILVLNYACCFGVELYVNGTMSSYYQDFFDVDQTIAGLIASLFGLMNLFARAIGGWASDKSAVRFGLRGRIWVILVTVLGAGGMLVIFSRIRVLWLAIVQLIIFSTFVQASEGATFGLVPFVNKKYTGIVSGFVGAGGNLGAMCWGFIHKAFGETDDEPTAYLIVGFIGIGSALSCLLIRMHGAAAIPFFGNDGREWLAEQDKNQEVDGPGAEFGAYGPEYAYAGPQIMYMDPMAGAYAPGMMPVMPAVMPGYAPTYAAPIPTPVSLPATPMAVSPGYYAAPAVPTYYM